MKVSDVMKQPIPTLSQKMTWKQAAEFLVENHLPSAPVVDDNGNLVGVLSEKDLFRGLFPKYGEWLACPEEHLDFEQMEINAIQDIAQRTIVEVMTKDIITATPDMPILKVGALMVARGIHQVPVTQDNKVVGMVQRGKMYMEILKRYFNIQRVK